MRHQHFGVTQPGRFAAGQSPAHTLRRREARVRRHRVPGNFLEQFAVNRNHRNRAGQFRLHNANRFQHRRHLRRAGGNEPDPDRFRPDSQRFGRFPPGNAGGDFHRRINRRQMLDQFGKFHQHQPDSRRAGRRNHRPFDPGSPQMLPQRRRGNFRPARHLRHFIESQPLQSGQDRRDRNVFVKLGVQRRRRQGNVVAINFQIVQRVGYGRFRMVGTVADALAAVDTARFRDAGLAAADPDRLRRTMAGATHAANAPFPQQPNRMIVLFHLSTCLQ